MYLYFPPDSGTRYVGKDGRRETPGCPHQQDGRPDRGLGREKVNKMQIENSIILYKIENASFISHM